MKALRFHGYSDDTFGEYAATNYDVDNCGSGNPIQCRLDSSEGSMLVIGQYARNDNPCWDIAIGQVDEDVPRLSQKLCKPLIWCRIETPYWRF